MHIERSDGTVTVSPQNEAQQSALVVIAHGLGDTAEGFADVAEVCKGKEKDRHEEPFTKDASFGG
jgi:hypothetical protein